MAPKVFGDEKRVFYGDLRQSEFENIVAIINLFKNNHSSSSQGILRGLHYQLDKPQGKLVRVVKGEVCLMLQLICASLHPRLVNG